MLMTMIGIQPILLAIVFLSVSKASVAVHAIELVAYVSQHGLHGEFAFVADQSIDGSRPAATLRIQTALQTTLQFPDQTWTWSLHQMPVDYTELDGDRRCADDRLGERLVAIDEQLGLLQMPGNESAVWDTEYALTGITGFWGKSLLLISADDRAVRVCATITTRNSATSNHQIDHMAEAHFHTSIGGHIYFRWLASEQGDYHDTIIHTDLYHLGGDSLAMLEGNHAGASFTNHSWKIYVTDIFDTDTERPEANCNVLQLVFDQQNRGSGRAIGDIDQRLGALKVATHAERRPIRQLFHDPALVLLPSDLMAGPQRQLYVVVFDNLHPDVFAACAKIRHVQQRAVRAHVQAHGMRGEIRAWQRLRFEPVWLNVTISAANGALRSSAEIARDMDAVWVHELPPNPLLAGSTVPDEYCASAGRTLNPGSAIDGSRVPPPGFGTQDQYEVGDLTGKLLQRSAQYEHRYFGGSAELNGIYWDAFLALSGPQSIAHRGLTVRLRNSTTSAQTMNAAGSMIVACGTFELYDAQNGQRTAMRSAQVLFRYPIVGRVLLRQPRDEWWSDTTVLIEYLIHADGAQINNTDSHRWAVHAEPPGADFYNWSERCVSAKDVFNPYRVLFNLNATAERCHPDRPYLCRIGDLSGRFGGLSIAGRKAERTRSRALFVDGLLPLSGHHNVLGKAFVIYDDNGPVARGERLACSIIGGHHWRKAVARDWYSNGGQLTIAGKLEMFQQSEYDMTDVEVGIKGLLANSGYHVHITPVEGNLEFPCEGSTLYGHWNPRHVQPKHSPPPTMGSTDQYEMGDLSGKFGTLDGRTEYTAAYNDTNLPLFGYETVLGRSIVIHKKEKMLRWACSTLERGYAPSEAREIRGIASFHHPYGHAFGYVRFTQLIHNDGSSSDTIVEVNLRHPGKHDRNTTRNHHWNIFVNPVGVDATVAQTATRCVAGGYIWNPFYTQLADPLNVDLYRTECGPDNPLRCYVGDVSARVGTIDLGLERKVFSDPNFPLEGVHNAMGRSIVLFGPDFSHERFACANIEPDHDIVKYILLQKPPKFVVAQFLEDVRHVMGLTEWMLSIDSRKTRTLHGGSCIQMMVHFKGGQAHRIERDLTLLIASGRLKEPSIAIPGYVDQKRKETLSYRACGVRDPNEAKSKSQRGPFSGSARCVAVAGSNWASQLAVALFALHRIWV